MRTALAALLLAAPASFASATEVPVTSEVEAVTVFLRGAEVTRIAKVKLEKGEHTVVLSDVPASAVPGSIRVEGKASGKMSVGSVDTARKVLQRAESAAADVERKKLEDEIETLRDERAVVEAEAQAGETQKALIGNLAQLPMRPAAGQGASVTGEDWPRVLGVIAQGARDASQLYLDAQKRLRDFDRRIDDLEKRLGALAPPRSEQTEVRVFVDAGSPLDADLTIRYQVPNASWSPIYDARLLPGSKTEEPKLDLVRRAAITQRSGEAWPNVSLKLSTASPSDSASMPQLDAQFVDFEPEIRPAAAPPAPMARLEKRSTSNDAQAVADAAGDAAESVAEEPMPQQAVTEIAAALSVAPFEATFEVPGKVSIAETGETKRVVLSTEQVVPVLSSRTVPKMEPNAYLYAALKLEKGTPLLPGLTYLFRGGTFIGTSPMPLLQPGEEHQLGFGVDDLVKVRHAVLEEKRGESGLISTSHVDSRNYRVTVKNLHDRPIDVVVLDRIPVARNQDIKVEYTGKSQPSKRDVEEKRGVVAYESRLEPDEEKVLEYGYRISWPAAKSITYGP